MADNHYRSKITHEKMDVRRMANEDGLAKPTATRAAFSQPASNGGTAPGWMTRLAVPWRPLFAAMPMTP